MTTATTARIVIVNGVAAGMMMENGMTRGGSAQMVRLRQFLHIQFYLGFDLKLIQFSYLNIFICSTGDWKKYDDKDSDDDDCSSDECEKNGHCYKDGYKWGDYHCDHGKWVWDDKKGGSDKKSKDDDDYNRKSDCTWYPGAKKVPHGKWYTGDDVTCYCNDGKIGNCHLKK